MRLQSLICTVGFFVVSTSSLFGAQSPAFPLKVSGNRRHLADAKSKPCFLAESGYEGESNDGRGGSPHRIRRQACWAILSGACGHLYGSAAWTVKPEVWRKWLNSPGAQHMADLGRFLESIPWHRIVPDTKHEIVTAGFGELGKTDYATTAWIPDGTLAITYLPVRRTVSVDLSKFNNPVSARWFDPTSGGYVKIAGSPFDNSGKRELTPPGKNKGGDSDFIFILEVLEK